MSNITQAHKTLLKICQPSFLINRCLPNHFDLNPQPINQPAIPSLPRRFHSSAYILTERDHARLVSPKIFDTPSRQFGIREIHDSRLVINKSNSDKTDRNVNLHQRYNLWKHHTREKHDNHSSYINNAYLKSWPWNLTSAITTSNWSSHSIMKSCSPKQASKNSGHQQGHQQQNHDSSDRDQSNYNPRFFYLFGLLGVFKSFTPDDIEEEKKKLVDEEKVKKMTPAELLIAKGVLALCDFQYDRAGDLFHQALELAKKEENEEQEYLVLNLLATNYFDSGQLETAEKLFIDLIKRLIAQKVEPSDPAILELSLKLSSIYSKSPKNEIKAFKGFEFVINSLLYSLRDLLANLDEINVLDISDQQRNDLALLGWAYDWFARHLMIVNDYEGALEMLRKALDISTKILGPLHDQTLILLNDVGTTLAMINRPAEGRGFIKQAVEGALESKSDELASFYVNFGLVNLQLSKLDEAKRYCEYSIELASKDPNHSRKSEIIRLSQDCLDEVKKNLLHQ